MEIFRQVAVEVSEIAHHARTDTDLKPVFAVVLRHGWNRHQDQKDKGSKQPQHHTHMVFNPRLFLSPPVAGQTTIVDSR